MLLFSRVVQGATINVAHTVNQFKKHLADIHDIIPDT